MGAVQDWLVAWWWQTLYDPFLAINHVLIPSHQATHDRFEPDTQTSSLSFSGSLSFYYYDDDDEDDNYQFVFIQMREMFMVGGERCAHRGNRFQNTGLKSIVSSPNTHTQYIHIELAMYTVFWMEIHHSFNEDKIWKGCRAMCDLLSQLRLSKFTTPHPMHGRSSFVYAFYLCFNFL